MTTAASAGYRFVWDPELPRVTALTREAWARPCWHYDHDLLAYYLDKPSGDRSLALGQETEAGELASYHALMPLDVELHGRRHPALFGSFLTAAAATRGTGVAHATQVRLLERAMEGERALYFTMCQVGAASNRSIEKACAAAGLPMIPVAELRYLAAMRSVLMRRLPPASDATRPWAPSDATALAALFDRAPAVGLRQRHRTEDFAHRFGTAKNRGTFVFLRDGAIVGAIHLLLLEVLDSSRAHRNVYLQDLALAELDDTERVTFLGDVVRALEPESYEAIFAPDLSPRLGAWKPLGFRLMPRALTLYGVPLRPELGADLARPMGVVDLDVY